MAFQQQVNQALSTLPAHISNYTVGPPPGHPPAQGRAPRVYHNVSHASVKPFIQAAPVRETWNDHSGQGQVQPVQQEEQSKQGYAYPGQREYPRIPAAGLPNMRR
jgi:hypothetical protein